MGVVRGCIMVKIDVWVYGWGGWVGWGVLKGYKWIGRRGEEKLHHYIIFVPFSSLVHEQNYIPST